NALFQPAPTPAIQGTKSARSLEKCGRGERVQILEQDLLVIPTEQRRRNDFRYVSAPDAPPHKILDNNRRSAGARMHIGDYMQYSHGSLRSPVAPLKVCLARQKEAHAAMTNVATKISRKAKAQ